MVVKVLGPLETGAGPLSPRERAVLSVLVVRRGTTVAPSELADAWWGDDVPRTWEQQVRNAVGRIRARLGSHSIETVGVTYRLGLDPDSIDAVQFERLVSAGRANALRDEHERAIDAYRRALALWRGEPLPDLTGWEPGVVEALRLQEIRDAAEEELLEARLAAGEHRSLLPDAERLLREQPLREDRWAIVALANYRADRQADALAVLRTARERLADELGVEPGARLAGLEIAILQRDPTLDAPPVAATVAATCPYPGLRAFGPDDADVFFGREDDTEAILESLAAGSVVTIAGASGTGKSSLLLAGVLPRLRERGRIIEVVRPGSGGVTAVRRALTHAHVLAVDQAEELLAASADDVAAFGALAHEFVLHGGGLLVTVRSDALDRLRALPRIGDAIGRSVYLLGGLTDAAYRSAIEDPARRSGLHLEAGLVELAVRDAGDRASTLPHLSHAMQETWLRREGATLTVAGYRAAGGIPGAIAQTAEEVFRGLPPDEQEVCRSLMLRLVDRGADGTSTRRRAAAAPLVDDVQRRRVLEQLAQARLVTIDEDAVTIAHESVATAWPRLDGWLEEDANGARTLRAVETAASAWDAAGRADDDLLRGARLHSALDWRDAAHPDLTTVEADLLDASAAREEQSVRELQEHAARERQRGRVLAMSLVGAAILLISAIVAGTLAGVRGQEAAAAAENAKVEAVVATSLSLRQSDRELAALLAAEAYRRWSDDSRVRSALWGTVTSAHGLVDTHRTENATVAAVAAIPGSATALRVAEISGATTIEIVDPASGAVMKAFDAALPPMAAVWYRDLSVSRDGGVAAIQTGRLIDVTDPDTCCWNQLTFIDLSSGEVLPGSQLLKMRTGTVIDLGEDGAVAYLQHPVTGDLIAVETRTGAVRASAARVFSDFTGSETPYRAGVVMMDGERVAAGIGDRIDIFDRATMAIRLTIPLGEGREVQSLAADGTGGLLVSLADELIRLPVDTGTVEWRRPLRTEEVCHRLLVTPRATVACSSYTGVSEFRLATGLPTRDSIELQLDSVSEIGVLDEATMLISSTFDNVWMRWRTDGSGAGSRLVAAGRVVTAGPDRGGGSVAARPTEGGPTELWHLDTDTQAGAEADGLVLLGGGIVARWDEGVGHRLENTATGEVFPYRIPGLTPEFRLIPGGLGRLAFVAFESRLVAFDPATGEMVGAPLTVPGWRIDGAMAASATPDESRVAFTWWDAETNVFETAVFELLTGELLVRGLQGVDETLVIGPDELIAATAQTVRRVALDTLEPRSSLARATGGSQAMDISRDGRTLLNVGWNNRLTLYDLSRDILLAEPIATDNPDVRGGYLAPDGKTLITAVDEGILLWDLVPEHQALTACTLAGRELREEEWATYFPGERQVETCAALADAAG